MARKSSTVRNAALVGGGTLVSRIAGLARDIALAFFFGVGGAMDAFFLAFLIPNLFRRLFGEGALSGAVVPVLTDYKEHKTPADASRLVSGVLTLLTVALGVVSLLGVAVVFIGGPGLLGYDGVDSEQWRVFSVSAVILAPLILLLCVSGVLAGVLNTYGKFTLPALLPAVQNLMWLAAILLVAWVGVVGPNRATQIQYMCFGVLAGGVLSVLWQVHAARKVGLTLRPSMAFKDEGVRKVGGAMGPTVLALALFQVNALVDVIFAEYFVSGEGAVSAFSYAGRLYQFPLGVLSVALGTAVFPLLAKHVARGEPSKVTGGLLNSLRLLAFIVLPAAAGLVALNAEIVTVVFQRGEFTPEAAQRTANVLFWFSLALPVTAALQVVNKTFYAMRDTKTPARMAVVAVLLNVVLNFFLVQTSMQEAGLALATGISGLATLIIMGAILSVRLRGTVMPSDRLAAMAQVSDRMARPVSPSGVIRFRWSLARSFLFSAAMATAVIFFMRLVPTVNGASWLALGELAGAMVLGAGIYAGLHYLFRSPEVRELLGREPHAP